jgi:site-specific recombinase XerC
MLKKWALVYCNERVNHGGMTRKTADGAWYTIADFALVFGNRPVTQLNAKAVSRWLASHPEWKPSTRVTKFTTMRSFCRWLLERGAITKDPFVGLRAPKRPRRTVRPLDRDRYDDLVAVLPDARARLLCALAYWCALRCVSISRLNVEDIDWQTKTLHVAAAKGGVEQQLPLRPQVELALNGYLRQHPATSGPLIRGYVHPHRRLSAHTIGTLVAGWMTEAGVKVHAHDGRSAHTWRSTAATEMAAATKDPYCVQELLGHSAIGTAVFYVARVGTDRLQVAMEAREAMV